jgi:hypothetical protein
VGSSLALDKLGSLRLTEDAEAADANDRAVTCVLSSHPQVCKRGSDAGWRARPGICRGGARRRRRAPCCFRRRESALGPPSPPPPRLSPNHSTTRPAAPLTRTQSRDIHLDSFTLLFHGHELLADAKLELNYGR